jgi:hypothetical protein
MTSKLKMIVIAATVIASSSAAFAATPSQDQERWFVESGRYVDGQIPSYSAGQHVLIEGRNSAQIDTGSQSHDAQVETLGN